VARLDTTQHEFGYRSAECSGNRRGVALVCCGMLLAPLTLAQTQAPPPAQTQAAPALKIVVLEGEGAINNIHQRHAKEPVVQVVDETGAPVNGASVAFLLPDTGPSGTFGASDRTLTVLTDEKGQAVGRGLAANQVAGKFEIRVVASHNGLTATAAITQTNAQPVGTASEGSSKKFLLLALIGGAVAGGAAFAAKGGHSGSSAPSVSTPPIGSSQGTVIIPGIPIFQTPH
jgi:hypothetical protein